MDRHSSPSLFAGSVLALSLCFAAFATSHAQQQSQPNAQSAGISLREAANDQMKVEAFNRTVDEVEDMDIHNSDGESIGEVEEVLIDADNKVAAVAAEVGGFLGLGDRDVIISIKDLHLNNNVLTTTLNKQQIAALPTWDD